MSEQDVGAPRRPYVVVGIRAGELEIRSGKVILRVCDPRLLEPRKKEDWDEMERRMTYSNGLFLNRYEPPEPAFDIPVEYGRFVQLGLKIGDKVCFDLQLASDDQAQQVPR